MYTSDYFDDEEERLESMKYRYYYSNAHYSSGAFRINGSKYFSDFKEFNTEMLAEFKKMDDDSKKDFLKLFIIGNYLETYGDDNPYHVRLLYSDIFVAFRNFRESLKRFEIEKQDFMMRKELRSRWISAYNNSDDNVTWIRRLPDTATTDVGYDPILTW